MSWLEGKKKYMLGLAAGLSLWGITRDEPEKSMPKDKPVKTVQTKQDNSEIQQAFWRQRAEELAQEQAAAQLTKAGEQISPRVDSSLEDDEEADEISPADVTEIFKRLEKARVTKQFLEQNVPGLKAKMSDDGEELLVAFPNEKGEAIETDILSLDLTESETVGVGTLTDFDALVSVPANNLRRLAEVVRKKFIVLAKNKELFEGKDHDDIEAQNQIINVIREQGLPMRDQ